MVRDNFADRLTAAIREKGAPVCVGIDPRLDRLPEAIRQRHKEPVEAIWTFTCQLLEVIAPLVPAVKPQSAYFEVYRAAGVQVYFDIVKRAREMGLIVIGDTKRNDIGSTAEAYAAGHLVGDDAPDAITVNGYFGRDGLKPFVDVGRERGKGLFVLVRTSNPSAPQVQDFADASGKKLYEHVAEQLSRLGEDASLVGECGYSSLGAVVGATYPDEARQLRRVMPRQIFLVPGYGAQGATAADCAAAFDAEGGGAIVNAGRSVIYAHLREDYAGVDWKQAVASAARGFAEDIRGAVGA